MTLRVSYGVGRVGKCERRKCEGWGVKGGGGMVEQRIETSKWLTEMFNYKRRRYFSDGQ